MTIIPEEEFTSDKRTDETIKIEKDLAYWHIRKYSLDEFTSNWSGFERRHGGGETAKPNA